MERPPQEVAAAVDQVIQIPLALQASVVLEVVVALVMLALRRRLVPQTLVAVVAVVVVLGQVLRETVALAAPVSSSSATPTRLPLQLLQLAPPP